MNLEKSVFEKIRVKKINLFFFGTVALSIITSVLSVYLFLKMGIDSYFFQVSILTLHLILVYLIIEKYLNIKKQKKGKALLAIFILTFVLLSFLSVIAIVNREHVDVLSSISSKEKIATNYYIEVPNSLNSIGKNVKLKVNVDEYSDLIIDDSKGYLLTYRAFNLTRDKKIAILEHIDLNFSDIEVEDEL